MERRRIDHAQAQAPGLAARDAAHALGRTLDVAQDAARIFQQGFAGSGQRHCARLAREQRRAQFALQRLDLLRQRRLADAKRQRRAREMPRFGHGNEVAQMTKLHDQYFPKIEKDSLIYWTYRTTAVYIVRPAYCQRRGGAHRESSATTVRIGRDRSRPAGNS
jgi:hypothetical protein